MRLYANPISHAHQQAKAWRASRPADAAQMDKIAAQPQTTWFADWNTNVRGDVSRVVGQAEAAARMPVLVAYNLPKRDCGGYSSGGAASPERYRGWIRAFADGIGDRRAAVILEPDGLAGLDCLSRANRSTHLGLISDAAGMLASHPGVSVYVDAGNSAWQPAADMAARLRQVGVARVRGFALNVSNFQSDASEIAYGRDIAARLGGAHFVVDTSRNGAGSASRDQWCNPPGRALGRVPSAETGDPAVDAFLWVKAPGESDGTCNGGPAAGQWWADYALGLAQRAAY
jgi:endoglucanase